MARNRNAAEQQELPPSDTNGHADTPENGNGTQKREFGKEALQRKLTGFQNRLHLMEEANKIVFTAGSDRAGRADKLIEIGLSPTEVADVLEEKPYPTQDGGTKWRPGFSYEAINAMKANVKTYTEMLEKYDARKQSFVQREEARRATEQEADKTF